MLKGGQSFTFSADLRHEERKRGPWLVGDLKKEGEGEIFGQGGRPAMTDKLKSLKGGKRAVGARDRGWRP